MHRNIWKVPKYNKTNTRKQSAPKEKNRTMKICRLCVRLYSSQSSYHYVVVNLYTPSSCRVQTNECRTDNDTLSGYTIIFKGCCCWARPAKSLPQCCGLKLLYIIAYIGLPYVMFLTGLLWFDGLYNRSIFVCRFSQCFTWFIYESVHLQIYFNVVILQKIAQLWSFIE